MGFKRFQMALVSFLWLWLAVGPFSSLHAQDMDTDTSPAGMLATRAQALMPEQYAVLPTSFMDEIHRRKAVYQNKLATDVALSEYLLNHYGYKTLPASLNPNELGLDAHLLTEILVSLSFFPPGTFPLQKNGVPQVHGIILQMALGGGSLALTGEELVRLSQRAFLPEDEKKRLGTLVHEEAHDLDDSLGRPSESAAWRNLSHWDKITAEPPFGSGEVNFYRWRLEKMELLSGPGLISQYAADGEREDFAESVTAYCFQNAVFQKVAPDKYKFIREKIFSNQDCSLGGR